MASPLEYNQVQTYLTSLVPPRPAVVQEMEDLAAKNNFPIIGAACGQVCYMFARLMNAKNIFELGSGYGYSTYWFARAVQENGGGMVHHTVWDDDLSQQAQGYLTRLGLAQLVTFYNAEAISTLKATPGQFDIIFNDIDKEAYPESLPVIKERLRPGGLLIIDNMLWSARIFDENDKGAATLAIKDFTEQITHDPDWIVTLLPIRDGMIVACKK